MNALSHFDLVFSLPGRKQRIKLTLEPNHDILPESAQVTYRNSDGEVYKSEPIDRRQHKIFKGSAWTERQDGSWDNLGWSRINIVKDGLEPLFEGAFALMHDNHHIQLRSKFAETMHPDDPRLSTIGNSPMVLWKDSDTMSKPLNLDIKKRSVELACASDNLLFNRDTQHPVYQGGPKDAPLDVGSMSLSSLLGKRQIDTSGMPSTGNSGGVNLKSTIGNPAGCPTTRKVALLGVATDCTYTNTFSSQADARSHVITTINTASEVYEKTFNITLGLQDLTVNDPSCPSSPPAATPWNVGCDANTTITDRLNSFSSWRGQQNDNNAYWMLLTNCATGAEVGLSWLGQLCVNDVTNSSGESTSGANVIAKTSTEWQVIAHESGHMFGAVHDCDSQTCSDGTTVNAQQCCPLSTTTCDASAQYIMNPSTGTNIQSFSPCTIGNICSAMLHNSVKSSCLVDNKGVTTISGQQCGNGIVEDGEECDCGGTESCKGNNCCDPSTCKFINSAKCDDSNEECCKGCQFAPSGTICSASTGVCDPQEVCSGSNATCPSDQTAPNGQGCGNGLQCASGQCTSRDLQCKNLMGSLTTNNDTYACDDTDCTLTCASPEFPANECYSMQQNFLDGTPCGGGGQCSNVSLVQYCAVDVEMANISKGVCSGSSLGGQISSWVYEHQPIVIGVASGVGGILLLSILVCIIRRCRKPRRSSRQKTIPSPMQQQQRWPGWNNSLQPGPQLAQQQQQHQGWGGYTGQSVRYA